MSRGQAVLAGGAARPGLEPSLAKEGAQGKRPPASLGVGVAKERLGDRVKQPQLDPRGNWHGPFASAKRGSHGERLWEQWLRVRFSLVHNRREIRAVPGSADRDPAPRAVATSARSVTASPTTCPYIADDLHDYLPSRRLLTGSPSALSREQSTHTPCRNSLPARRASAAAGTHQILAVDVPMGSAGCHRRSAFVCSCSDGPQG